MSRTAVAFFEVTTTDTEHVQRFYAELFGRQAADPAMGAYGLIDTGAGGGAVGGIGPASIPADAGARLLLWGPGRVFPRI